MKNLKKSCALFVLFILLCSCLSACAGGATGSDTSHASTAAPVAHSNEENSADSAQTNSEKGEAAKAGPENAAPEADESKSANPEPGQKELHIGILQFAQHPSLDNCREGFLKGLAESGFVEGQNLTVDVQNAQADMGICGQIAAQFAGKKLDLICAIATPAAMSAYNAAQSKGIPVIYTAISDPVAAQLADSDKKPLGEVTGTSDRLPIKEQLSLIREVLPDAKNIGILFSTSEANSVSMLEVYKKLAPEYGFEIVDSEQQYRYSSGLRCPSQKGRRSQQSHRQYRCQLPAPHSQQSQSKEHSRFWLRNRAGSSGLSGLRRHRIHLPWQADRRHGRKNSPR